MNVTNAPRTFHSLYAIMEKKSKRNYNLYSQSNLFTHLTDAIKVKIDNKLKKIATEPCTISHMGILGSRGHKSWFCAPNC